MKLTHYQKLRLDVMGRLVLEQKSRENIITINSGSIPDGVYFIKVFCSEKWNHAKIT